MNNFITIKEASDITGKSEITIRRLIKHLLRQKDNESSQVAMQKGKQSIHLTTQDIKKMIKQEFQNDRPDSPFIYKINENLIRQVFGLVIQNNEVSIQKENIKDSQKQKETKQEAIHEEKNEYSSKIEPEKVTTQQDSRNDEVMREVVGMLREQLSAKDSQIQEKDKQINQLIERDRETNVLLKGLQERVLQLSSGEVNKEEKDTENIV